MHVESVRRLDWALAAVCPGSVLQLHPHASGVIDDAAASQFRLTEFYETVSAHKPLAQHY
ncbi:hypothetical protein [Rhodococcus sp. IEGM 1318]|uniref:hypothetical protein n=1 Tax=Rhodococcus sp. IEGM 1318 TaxID=3082226 RepID=UPI002954FCE4|nr:hypothetical protein [Rhodococcus sp. IEGM 1318]MDV8007861.1 hypothetical protein [Rhodococcus sp. IEGM 1318]